MFSKKYQLFAIKQLQDSLNDPVNEKIESRVFSVIAFASLIGGRLSEYNLVILLKHCGVDLDNKRHLTVARNLLAFYCGNKILDIIDNNLGLAETLKDPFSESFQKGLDADTSVIEDSIRRLQKNLVESIVRGSEAYDEEKDWISNLP